VVGAAREWVEKASNEKMGQIDQNIKGGSLKKLPPSETLPYFMHCVVGLPGEELLLNRVRAPGTNWEALNCPPQHREEMR